MEDFPPFDIESYWDFAWISPEEDDSSYEIDLDNYVSEFNMAGGILIDTWYYLLTEDRSLIPNFRDLLSLALTCQKLYTLIFSSRQLLGNPDYHRICSRCNFPLLKSLRNHLNLDQRFKSWLKKNELWSNNSPDLVKINEIQNAYLSPDILRDICPCQPDKKVMEKDLYPIIKKTAIANRGGYYGYYLLTLSSLSNTFSSSQFEIIISVRVMTPDHYGITCDYTKSLVKIVIDPILGTKVFPVVAQIVNHHLIEYVSDPQDTCYSSLDEYLNGTYQKYKGFNLLNLLQK